MKKVIKMTKNILLAFVFMSIGVIAAKYLLVKGPANGVNFSKSAVRVYYMHGTMRCTTCNNIEKMTETLLENKYSKEISDGKIEFTDVNFQKNKNLAKEFDIVASCVVVAKIDNNKITAHQRLDRVWELYAEPEEFNEYISNAIEKYLGNGENTN